MSESKTIRGRIPGEHCKSLFLKDKHKHLWLIVASEERKVNLKLIAKIVHEYDAYIVGDGVSYAPHGFPDVKDLDIDFYSFSLYKTYGPHLGLLYGKKEILNKITILRIKNLPHHNVNYFLRGFAELFMPFKFLWKLRQHNIEADTIIVYSPPLFLSLF